MGRGRPPIFDEEQELAIVRRYKSKIESVSAIAETLGVQRQTISRVLHKHGIDMRWHHHKLTPIEENEIAHRFEDGETARDLAQFFGMDHTSIARIVRDKKGPLRRCGRPRKFNSNKEWRESPPIRIRNLVHAAKSRATERGWLFDEEIYAIANNPPTICACCKVRLDYSIRSREEREKVRSPSLDRCENTIGYVVGNVYVVCFRCNRLKSDAALDELIALGEYAKNHRTK